MTPINPRYQAMIEAIQDDICLNITWDDYHNLHAYAEEHGVNTTDWRAEKQQPYNGYGDYKIWSE